MLTRLLRAVFFVFSLGPLMSGIALAGDGWIDVHFHIVGDKGEVGGFEAAAKSTLEIMDAAGIDRAILMSPPRPFVSFDTDEISVLAKKYPSRFAFMGGGGSLNPMIQATVHANEVTPAATKEFEDTAEKIVASGARGFGEIAIHHVSLNPGHGYESVPADHPLLLLLTDIAAKHDMPIDIHFDPIPADVETPPELSSPKNPPLMKENVKAFERLLEHNPKAKIVWAHAGSDPVGFYTVDLVRRLMERHPNLYCSVRTTFKRNHPMRHPVRGISRDWVNLLKDFPDRFVMGTDSFVITPDYTGPSGPEVLSQNSWVQREGAKAVLAYLDAELARKIGRENAIRIYHLQ